MREDDDRRARCAAPQVGLEPRELVVAELAQAVRLEMHDVDEREEVHALVVEAVVAPVRGSLAEAAEVFGPGTVGHVVLAGHRMQVR